MLSAGSQTPQHLQPTLHFWELFRWRVKSDHILPPAVKPAWTPSLPRQIQDLQMDPEVATVCKAKRPAKSTKEPTHQPLQCLSLHWLYCQWRNIANNYLSCGFQPESTHSTQICTAIFYSSCSIFFSKPELPQAIVFLSHCTWCTQASNSGTAWIDWSKGDLFILIL